MEPDCKTKKCECCKKVFEKNKRIPYSQWEKQKYCSRECFDSLRLKNGFGKWNKGKKRTQEFKQNMSLIKKGKKPYTMTEATRLKISEVRKLLNKEMGLGFKPGNTYWDNKKATESRFKKGQNVGTKNHNWKGGITPIQIKIRTSKRYQEWREKVFKRDNYTCQKCKKRGGNMNAHHIKTFSENQELRFLLKNGITFCEKCHRQFHKKYGHKNIGNYQLTKFLL